MQKPFLRLWDYNETQWEPLSREQWWTLLGVTSLPKLLLKSINNSSRGSLRNLLQASLASGKIGVHDSAIRNWIVWGSFHWICLNERVQTANPLLTKKNTMACLIFVKKHIDDRKHIRGEKSLWIDDIKVDLFANGVPLWYNTNTALPRTSSQASNIVVVVWWSGQHSWSIKTTTISSICMIFLFSLSLFLPKTV